MKIIILDTNFLIYCANFKVDLFSEIERICHFPYKLKVLDATIKELEIVKPKGLSLIKKFIEKLEVIKAEDHYVDDELTNLSEKGYIIATQDKELKDRLKGPVIVIRQKKYLQNVL